MLSEIKEMIAGKNAFLEAADMLFEDGSTNIDSTIVLGEEVDEPMDGEIEEEGEPEADTNDEGSKEDEKDILDTPIDDAPAGGDDTTPSTGDSGVDDILDSPIDEPAEQPMPLPGNEIPTPVGRQTGEPIDGIDDILNAEIDLKTNTMKDTLPIPPTGAADAVAEDGEMDSFLNQRIDSGYGDSATESSYTEAITLDGGDDSGSSDTSTEPASDTSTGDDTSADGGDNTVTAAVKDKVDEVSDDSTGDLGGDGSGSMSQDKKDEVMKKLSSVTKNLEDAKKAIIDAI